MKNVIYEDVRYIPFVGEKLAKRLQHLDIKTIKDLIDHIPSRYIDYKNKKKISEIFLNEMVTIRAKVDKKENITTKSGKTMQIIKVKDNTGTFDIIFFNQPYLLKNFSKNTDFFFSGKVKSFKNKLCFFSPLYEKVEKKKEPIHTGRIVPIYPETKGLTSKVIRKIIQNALELAKKQLHEFLPKEILKEEELPTITKAYQSIHNPTEIEEIERARKRLALNELLGILLKSLKRKKRWQETKKGYPLKIDKKKIALLRESLPFKLTSSQESAIEEILEDLKKDKPMNRLLEGDVGSGKTIVAAFSMFAAYLNNFQSVLMAPTQILAQQHFDTLSKIFKKFKIKVQIITSETKNKKISADIIVGTQALIQEKITLDKVALVVIDEQHKFGVRQRALLAKKATNKRFTPHILTMTATPIPRTVALTAYGDLDLSLLKELPKGRKPVKTFIVPSQKREAAKEWIKKKIKNDNSQVYVICPLIEESNKENVKNIRAAKKEYEKLQKYFPDFKVGLLHGKMKREEKEKVMRLFKEKRIDILVTTPVVEVGVDIKGADIIVIEGAERFGLSQLHQLRGRVGRGKKNSFCLLFTEKKSKRIIQRLNYLKKIHSGFELAEIDLQLRGPGEIYGLKQHGFPKLKIASWKDRGLIKKAKKLAQMFLENEKKYKNVFRFFSLEEHYLLP